MKVRLVGFTGTRLEMKKAQQETCRQVLTDLFSGTNGSDQFRHGDCIGSDEQAHKIVEYIPWVQIHIHPPEDNRYRAYCRSICCYIYKPKPYLDRNKDIVNETKILVAVPRGPEERRSGTWSTVRYARSLKHYIIVIWPDGRIDEEN